MVVQTPVSPPTFNFSTLYQSYILLPIGLQDCAAKPWLQVMRHYCSAAGHAERHLGPTWPSKWLYLQSRPHSPPPPEKTVASGIKSAVLQNDRMPLLGKQSVS